MFCIEKIFHFEAGHCLMHHDGKCSHPHGHSYVLIVKICDKRLGEEGSKKNMVIDFDEVSKTVQPMIDQYFDHCWLNDTLSTDSPTAEYIAQWIFRYLKPSMPNLAEITIQETATAKVTYSEYL